MRNPNIRSALGEQLRRARIRDRAAYRIVRVPPWQVAAELAAGRLRRILVADEPSTAPLHSLFQPSGLASPKIRVFVDYLVERMCGFTARRRARKAPEQRSNADSIFERRAYPVGIPVPRSALFSCAELGMNARSIFGHFAVALIVLTS
jgi:hypothetical protein